MDRAKKARKPFRTKATKNIGEIDAELNVSVPRLPQKSTMTSLLEKLDAVKCQLLEKDEKVMDSMLDAGISDAELEVEVDEAEEYSDKIRQAKRRIEDLIKPKEAAATPASSSMTSSSSKKTYVLPKTEIKKFKGEVTEWLSWWAQFQKIHEDKNLHDSDKFQYLAQAMVEGTKAAEVVKVYPQTAANYDKAISALRERFGKEKVLKRVYVRELLKLIIQNSREKLKIGVTFDKLEGHLRALESLGITPDQMDVILFPMVESCVPDDILMAWQRSPNYGREDKTSNPPKTEFDFLLEFVKQEVENEDQRKMAQAGFGIGAKAPKKKESVYVDFFDEGDVPTAAGLASTKVKGCIFCDLNNHPSQECFKARKLSLEQRSQKVKDKGACFRCLKTGHFSRNCKVAVECSKCTKEHYTIMCRGVEKKEDPPQPSFAVANYNDAGNHHEVLLKVVVVKAIGPRGCETVRMLIDEGSQASYIGSKTIKKTGCKSNGVEYVRNMLLGGVLTNLHEEKLREVEVSNLTRTNSKKWILREKPIVCTALPRVPFGPWVDKLKEKKIAISDLVTDRVVETDIEILIGSDLRGQIMTGKRINLGNGLFAEETIFGWALGGPIPVNQARCSNMLVSMMHRDLNLQDLMSLDTLGIKDPIEKKTKIQEKEEAKKHFLKNVSRKDDGRYVVGLPWIKEKPDLPSNKGISEKRLKTTTRKLEDKKAVEVYDGIFERWEELGIVEPVYVDMKEDRGCHYLPHHPVFKPESKTTPVRPVFDASCKIMRNPSLNDCLYKRPNLIELIPAVLHRFRERRIGCVSDIGKAFQMIEVRKEDRDYQRFLWWTDRDQEILKIFRHTRVVFGVTSSPFLLGAVLELHLTKPESKNKKIEEKLLRSMYVDNSITSVDTIEEYEEFRRISTSALAEAKMELREWDRSSLEASGIGPSRTSDGCGLEPDVNADSTTRVLGLIWDRDLDTISCDVSDINVEGHVTKRKILSTVAKIFDPIGVTCPVTLQPKLMLQDLWKTKKGWDDELEEKDSSIFMKWCKELFVLAAVQIPRQMMYSSDPEKVQLHVFTDASQYAYATVIFIRSIEGSDVRVQLVQAKARVAPLKGGTIPRLELMGCLIGVRLLDLIRESLDMEIKKIFHWTDSTTALAWIRGNQEWGTFVANRVDEIRRSTLMENWKHIAGVLNPADLPSRGCSPQALLDSKWWEGMDWLKKPEEEWPSLQSEVDEAEVKRELKGQKKTVLHISRKGSWFDCKFSSFRSNVKVMGWICRYFRNLRLPKDQRLLEEKLSPREFEEAENTLLKLIQNEGIIPDLKEIQKKLAVVKKSGFF